MHPIFIQLGPITVYWYGVLAAIAAMVAYYLLLRNRKYANMSKDQASSIIFYCVIFGGAIGARIFYVLLNLDQFRGGNWPSVFRIDQGGLVFYGGFFLAVTLLVLYCLRNKLSIIAVFDVMAPALAIGHGIARVGCLMTGCCYGKPTEFFLSVTYPASHEIAGIAVHPSQIYEALTNTILGLFLLWLLKRSYRGVTFSAYIIGYAILRFLNEFLRGDHPDTELVCGLAPAQLIGLLLLPLGVALMIYFARRKESLVAAVEAEAQVAEHGSKNRKKKRKKRNGS